MKVTHNEKHSGLSKHGINYRCERFCDTGSGTLLLKLKGKKMKICRK